MAYCEPGDIQMLPFEGNAAELQSAPPDSSFRGRAGTACWFFKTIFVVFKSIFFESEVFQLKILALIKMGADFIREPFRLGQP